MIAMTMLMFSKLTKGIVSLLAYYHAHEQEIQGEDFYFIAQEEKPVEVK